MANTYSNLLYHIVFSTKGRLPLISSKWQQELYQYIGGIIRNANGILLECGGMPDHIHLAIKLKTDSTVSDMLRQIKGSSSKWLNERLENRERFGWQDGYGAFTISESQLNHVINYIRGQEEHHRKKTFQEEYLDFLKLNNVEFDERYLWN